MLDYNKNNFFQLLKDKSKIIFGPYLGEIGWEMTRWSGMVRQYKRLNNNKLIYVSTRKGRQDLYYNSVDEIHTFVIKDDYIKYRPNMNRLDFWPKEELDNLIYSLKSEFKNFHICLPPMHSPDRNFFRKDQMDFNITPNPSNIKVIKEILSKHNNKIPICISPRHRIDSPKPTRNWPKQYWYDLFKNIKNTNKYIVFIIGSISSMVIPPEDETFIVVDRIKEENTSNIGLTISAIKNSVVTIGQQSALPVLSNYLGIKTIMWGNEKTRHQTLENPMNTRCIFFEELSVNYNTDPRLIFGTILEETKNAYRV